MRADGDEDHRASDLVLLERLGALDERDDVGRHDRDVVAARRGLLALLHVRAEGQRSRSGEAERTGMYRSVRHVSHGKDVRRGGQLKGREHPDRARRGHKVAVERRQDLGVGLGAGRKHDVVGCKNIVL